MPKSKSISERRREKQRENYDYYRYRFSFSFLLHCCNSQRMKEKKEDFFNEPIHEKKKNSIKKMNDCDHREKFGELKTYFSYVKQTNIVENHANVIFFNEK